MGFADVSLVIMLILESSQPWGTLTMLGRISSVTATLSLLDPSSSFKTTYSPLWIDNALAVDGGISANASGPLFSNVRCLGTQNEETQGIWHRFLKSRDVFGIRSGLLLGSLRFFMNWHVCIKFRQYSPRCSIFPISLSMWLINSTDSQLWSIEIPTSLIKHS